VNVVDRLDRVSCEVEVGRERLRVTITGEGRPLLLIMGLGGNVDMWGRLERELVPLGFRVIAFDAPGTGGSGPPQELRHMAGMADLTAGLLDALGEPQVDVLGVSFGGAIAQELALRHPHRVSHLVLAATNCGLGSWPGDPWATALLLSPLGYFLRSRSRRMDEVDKMPTLLGYWSQLYAATGWTSWPRLGRISQPTLVLAADNDDLVPLANGRQLAAGIPGARLEIIEGGDHLFLLHRPARPAALIGEFLLGAGQPSCV
jgi:pimeloyl-ACP methyl ester carboxylesterase